MKKLLSFLFLSFALCLNFAWAQSTVSGTVTDANNGEPLEGVAVIVKGTTVGVLTGSDGTYSLKIPSAGETLQFSFVGKKKIEEAINGRSSINASLVDDQLELEETVITAFGVRRDERALTNSVQEVGGDAIVNSRETNVISALSGKVSGVQVTNSGGQPGASANIVIRGYTSLRNDNQPLFVIDGVIIDNSQTSNTGDVFSILGDATFSNRGVDISPDDIEDLTVLKGPAATALYGSRAQNGVIVITTKKGGQKGGKGLNVTYSTAVSIDQVNKLPALNELYGQGFGGAYVDGISTSWGPKLEESAYDEEGDLIAGSGAAPYDRSEFFQNGLKWDQNFSIGGGTPENNILLSASRTQQTGIIPNDKFERTSARLTGQSAITSKLSLSSSLNYVRSVRRASQAGSNVNGIMLGLLRTPPSFDNSNGVSDPTDSAAYVMPDGTQRNYRNGSGYDNPYWTANQNPFFSTVNRVYGFGGLNYRPFKWMDITYKLTFDTYTDLRKQRFARGSSGTYASGMLYENSVTNYELNSNLFITLQHDFSEDFSGSLLLGNNMNHRYFQNNFTQGTDLEIPGFYNISNAASITTSEYNETIRLAGLFASLDLEYKRMLYLNLTGRNDWASTFGEDNNNFFYPAVSAGFVFTEALGLQDNKIFPYGKIRASWASAGKEPGAYLLNTPYTAPQFGGGFIGFIEPPYLGVNYFTLSDLVGNPGLQPEVTRGIEVGADLRFYNGRAGIDFTYYNQVTSNQIIPVQIAPSSGFTNQVQNAGKVKNSGIEMVLNGTPVKTDDFSWDIMVNFTRNRTELTELTEDADFINVTGINFASISSRAVVGQAYGLMYGGVFERTSDGQMIIDDDPTSINYGNPLVSSTDSIVGDPNPDWLMGITNTFSYKGISLSFLFDIRKGGDIWNGTRGALNYFGASEETAESRYNNEVAVFDGVTSSSYDANPDDPSSWEANSIATPLNQDWYFGGPGSGFTGPTEQFIEDGSWVRLRELTLAYSLPKSLLGSTFINGVDVSFTGRNLALWTNYTGVDPETSLRGAGNVMGWDYFNQPNTKSYVVGLKLSF